jgi:BirA family biotin operon repressor/biotin-[acetyl-CoA-carboxylase] ligase
VKTRLIKKIAQTESTNSLAMEMGKQGAVAGTVVVAVTQTRGRGRLQREWFSPPGTGLYFSIILRPQLEPIDLPKITLAAGVAICQAFEQVCQLSLGIKWPNDLLVDGKKLGGILCETAPINDSNDEPGILVILGVGLNITTPESAFPEQVRGKATSLLAATGQDFDKETVLDAVLGGIDDTIARLESGKFGAILDQWRARDVLLGKTLSWLNPAGRVVTGRALGIDGSGQYHIRDIRGRIHRVVSGDINLAIGY